MTTTLGSGVLRVERLSEGEGERWRMIRVRALKEAPHAFGTTLAEVVTWPSSRWQQQVVELATFVAALDGCDVGVARGAPHPTRPDVRELISMWVDPSARRRGLGASLIDAVADWAVAQGATALILDVKQRNAPAVALYDSCGFERCEGDALGAPEPGEVRMIKALRIAGD